MTMRGHRFGAELLIVVGVCLLAYGAAGFGGGTGFGDEWGVGFGPDERGAITLGAGLIAVGALWRQRS
jgi:hypothetical protein